MTPNTVKIRHIEAPDCVRSAPGPVSVPITTGPALSPRETSFGFFCDDPRLDFQSGDPISDAPLDRVMVCHLIALR